MFIIILGPCQSYQSIIAPSNTVYIHVMYMYQLTFYQSGNTVDFTVHCDLS